MTPRDRALCSCVLAAPQMPGRRALIAAPPRQRVCRRRCRRIQDNRTSTPRRGCGHHDLDGGRDVLSGYRAPAHVVLLKAPRL